MSYSSQYYARVSVKLGTYAGRILKGARPSDMPVTQSTKFELVINRLRRHGRSERIPFRRRCSTGADEVIE